MPSDQDSALRAPGDHIAPTGHPPLGSVEAPSLTPAHREQLERREPLEQAGGPLAAPDLTPEQRRLLKLGKKKEEAGTDQQQMEVSSQSVLPQGPTAATSTSTRSPPPLHPDSKTRAQPIAIHQHPVASPSRLRSQSPMLNSPASSEIFERNVQEPVPISTLGSEMSPAHIPSHVITEDHIPPALEASANAITSEVLNPDDVEIVTSTAHQPAGASVLEASASQADLQSLNSPMQSPLQNIVPTLQQQISEESEPPASVHQSSTLHAADDDTASNYAQLDPNDVRRLSFISFKDIVQSEHQQPHGHLAASVDSLPERTASPRLAGGGITTPPPSVAHTAAATSQHQVEQSPVRSVTSGLAQPPLHGELAIETLGQALRKTASGDLSSGRNAAGMSPTSDGNSGFLGRARKDS